MLKRLALASVVVGLLVNVARSDDIKKSEKEAFSITAENCKAICAKGRATQLTDQSDKRHYKDCFTKALCVVGTPLPNALPLAVAPKINFPSDAIKRLLPEFYKGPNEVKG